MPISPHVRTSWPAADAGHPNCGYDQLRTAPLRRLTHGRQQDQSAANQTAHCYPAVDLSVCRLPSGQFVRPTRSSARQRSRPSGALRRPGDAEGDSGQPPAHAARPSRGITTVGSERHSHRDGACAVVMTRSPALGRRRRLPGKGQPWRGQDPDRWDAPAGKSTPPSGQDCHTAAPARARVRPRYEEYGGTPPPFWVAKDVVLLPNGSGGICATATATVSVRPAPQQPQRRGKARAPVTVWLPLRLISCLTRH